MASYAKLTPEQVWRGTGEPNWLSVNGGTINGNVTVQGTFTATNLTATGAVSGATVSATGAVSGATVTATGAVSGDTVSATTVNKLNKQLQLGLSVSPAPVSANPTTAQLLVNTPSSFAFVSGGVYQIDIPVSFTYDTPTFTGVNTAGTIKIFGYSSSAFPVIATGVTPGFSFTVASTYTSTNSFFGVLRFTAVASATTTEPLSIAVITVGGLLSANVVGQINPTTLSQIAVVRIG